MIRQRGRSWMAKMIRAAVSLLTSLGVAASSAQPLWAQRRREQPEANPSFQQDLGKSSSGGGPVEPSAAQDSGGGAASAASADEEAPRSGGGVQIGAAPAQRAAPAVAISPLETRVSVRVKGAPLATFLDTISAQAKVNFIITEGLESKRVTAFLQNVTVREALQILLEIKGLTYQQIGKSNTYVISPRSKTAQTLITRIYTLSYIPLISLGDGKSATPGGGAGTPDSGLSIVTVLKSVLSGSGQVALEPRTNSLVVTDIPEVFPQIEQIIAELDKKAPQVMIEAQIVEIDSNRTKELGFEWGGANGELGTFTAGERDTKFPLNLPSNLGKTRFFDPINTGVSGSLGNNSAASSASGSSGASGTSSIAAGAIGQTVTALTSGRMDLTQLAVTLRALVQRQEARFLGKPKILTLNNKSASIQITDNAGLSKQTTVTGSGGGPTTTSAAIERATTGLTLNVTPQVNKEGYITMLVQPSVTDTPQSLVSTPGNPVFDTNTRAASTLVRVKNGQTLVLGGLLESTESKTVRKVPLLGYIPLIGWLFTEESVLRRNIDLVIFITPTIVGD